MDYETVQVAAKIGPLLAPDETVEVLTSAPTLAASVNAVTDKRGMILRTKPNISVDDEFSLRDVLRVRAVEDDVSHCVRIWLVDEGFFIMRTTSQPDAERLAEAITVTYDDSPPGIT